MECFLIWLEKYDLLIELIITVLTVALSLYAVFQTKIIAERQERLQEKEIKISVYEQKNQINKALNSAFDIAAKMKLFFEKLDVMKLNSSKMYDVLKAFLNDIDVKNTSYILEQSRFFVSSELYANIRTIRFYFMTITTNIDCFDLIKEDEEGNGEETEEMKTTLVDEIYKSCAEIAGLQSVIEKEMIQELKFS